LSLIYSSSVLVNSSIVCSFIWFKFKR
jgi:hypothetical protein